MSRKPVDIAHINLRIRESLRKKLADEAKKHRFSLNNEIRVRLEQSFEREGFKSLTEAAASVADTQKVFQSIAKTAAQLEGGLQGAFETAARLVGRIIHEDHLRATEELVASIEQDDQDAIKAALARVKETTLKTAAFPLPTTRVKP